MARHITINNLPHIRNLDQEARSAVRGCGVSNAYLFRSAPRMAQVPMNLNIENLEINNYDITNNIGKLIQQTNNQLQLSTINVNSGDGSAINIDSNQGLNGSNSSVA